MIKLAVPDLPVIAPLVQKRVEEANLQQRITVDNALGKIHGIVESGNGAVFVDVLLEPTVVVVLATGTSPIFEEKFCNILLLYVDSAKRDLRKALEAMQTIETYARNEKCTTVYGESWVWRGAEGIDGIYQQQGYERQSVCYVKTL